MPQRLLVHLPAHSLICAHMLRPHVPYLQADFVTTANRESIMADDWNREMCKAIPGALLWQARRAAHQPRCAAH